jgi:ABC-type transporter Mla maintaining outer membrane lipid asymmetry permease subunit MlaE
VRFILPGTGMFVLSVLVISQGLDVLWSAPPLTSWMMLIGIGGHAFIATGLLAASFVYYRDAMRFVQEFLQRTLMAQTRTT